MARVPQELRREIATIGTDPNRTLYGNRILIEDATLAARGRGKGLALYDEIARDDQVATVLQKRRLALLGRRWEVEPADESQAAADAAALASAVLKALPLEALADSLLDAILKGISFVELVWDSTDAGIVPVAAKHRDPRRFTFVEEVDARGQVLHVPRLLTRERPIEGIALPARKFLTWRFGDRYDNPWGLGLGHRLFWPVFFKRQGVAFWLSGLEKFGQPTALGRYPAGTPEAEQKKLLAALQAISTDAGVAIPEGMAIELVEAKRSGTFDAYESLTRYMDEAISRIVLGETLTTSNGTGGSRALGEVQNDVRLEITRADADMLAGRISATLLRWITEVNMPAAPPPRLWWDVAEPDDLAAAAARDKALAEIGYRPTLDRVTEVYGEGYEPVSPSPVSPLPAAASDAPAADALARLFAEAARRAPPPPPPRDVADDLADQLATLAEGEDTLVRALTALVDRATSLQDVADQLVSLLPELEDARLAALMGQAIEVAALAGRSDIADGAR
jgi:phage gp29-like protein